MLFFSGSELSFHNPMKSFFAFNPPPNLTKIDVSDRRKFTIERIEEPKPNSLLMMSNDNYFVIETGDGGVAEEIFQRISAIQNICSSGVLYSSMSEYPKSIILKLISFVFGLDGEASGAHFYYTTISTSLEKSDA